MSLHVWDFPVKIVEGLGSVATVSEHAARLGARSVSIVTDEGVRAAGLADAVTGPLRSAGIAVSVFSDVEPDPGRATVLRCTEAVKASGASLVVTVGGGSAMCAAKGAALLATNGGDIKDYKGIGKYQVAPLPVIAIPTTAGSGSEVSPKFILTDEDTGEKMTIGGPACYPAVAILDAQLLLNLPYNQAVVSSLDALSHAVEGFVARGAGPFTDALAWWAVAIFYRDMEAACVPGACLAEKTQVLAAGSLANMACGTAGLGLVHALELAMPEVSHGQGCGLLLPEVMAFNLPACLPRMARLAEALGVPPGLSAKDAAWQGIANLRALYRRLGFPARMIPSSPWTLKPAERVERALRLGDRVFKDNPRECTAADVAAIFRAIIPEA